MTNQCKFEVGDKVKKINGLAFSNGELVATVSEINNYGEVWLKETGSWLPQHSLCSTTTFRRSDLKDGMMVTYRDGSRRFLLAGVLYGQKGRDNGMFRGGCLVKYTNDLRYSDSYFQDLDIMKVEYMEEVLWEREGETAEQKRIKELEEGIAKMQEELNKLL